jgi:hypothetical protein
MNEGHEFTGYGKTRNHHEREGHEFTRAVKPLKMNQRFSA